MQAAAGDIVAASLQRGHLRQSPQSMLAGAVRSRKGPHALRSCLALPLIDGDTVVAVLALYGQGASAFTSDHVRLLELLAPRLAAALARATAKDETLEHEPVPVAALKLIKGA